MRFVHSLDDNVLAHVAGGLTAIVAAATALFSGHILVGGTAPAAPHPPAEPYVEAVPYDDSGTSDRDPVQSLRADTADEHLGLATDSAGASTQPATVGGLSSHILGKEDAVDAMNTDIDTLLQDVKSGRGQRRR
jgi:hypothetical protein